MLVWYIRGDPCPVCGGCDFYCADCVYPQLAALRVIATAAQAIVDNDGGCASGGWREGAAFLRLAEAVDAWRALEKEE